MTVPLIILGTFAIFAGVLNMAPFHFEPMSKWLDPVFEAATKGAVVFKNGGTEEWAHHLELPLMAGGIGAFVVGTGLSYWMYILRAGEPAKQIAEAAPGLYQLVLNKWRIDELYENTVLAMVDALADTFAAFDQTFVDGILARLTALVVQGLGTVLRVFQNGVVHVYATFMVLGLAAVSWFFVAPHADAAISDKGNGDYVIDASAGPGYAYRWDADGNGKPDSETYGAQQQVKVHLEQGKTQTVRLEVQNAFGLHGAKEINLARPEAPKVLEVGQN
jgi:NADH-quinone oxidoreductase subunit L